MRVAVLGAGVIGVTTAYYLSEAGHEVELIDRQAGVAMETSFANAGEISPGYASPWAAPGIPAKALRWLFMEHAPLIMQPRPALEATRWLLALLGNCSPGRYAVNKERMVRLAEYSCDKLGDIRSATGIRYDERARGTLQLFRKQRDLDNVGKDVAVLAEHGVPFELLDRAGCIAAEPGLAHAAAGFVGGLRLPRDETGDCFKFTEALARLIATKGVRFRPGETVERIVRSGGKIEMVATDKGAVHADAYVVALGSYSPLLLRPLGIRLPVYPVKGYSVTLPIARPELAPVSTLLDESYKVAITRLGDRIRVGGMAEIAGYDRSLPPRRRDTLLHSVGSLFPDAASPGEANFWTGLRPMTPDGPPFIGRSGIPNLFLNTGHGTLGWTMACGSGRIVADIVSGKESEIRSADFAPGRPEIGV